MPHAEAARPAATLAATLLPRALPADAPPPWTPRRSAPLEREGSDPGCQALALRQVEWRLPIWSVGTTWYVPSVQVIVGFRSLNVPSGDS